MAGLVRSRWLGLLGGLGRTVSEGFEVWDDVAGFVDRGRHDVLVFQEGRCQMDRAVVAELSNDVIIGLKGGKLGFVSGVEYLRFVLGFLEMDGRRVLFCTRECAEVKGNELLMSSVRMDLG